MANWFPQMPQFREADGSLDWWQIADMVIPGNVWDSQTNQVRPRGVVAGLASSAFGPIGGAVVEGTAGMQMPNMPRFGNPFRGFGNWLSSRTGRDRYVGPAANEFGPHRSYGLPRINSIRDRDTISGGGFESERNPYVSRPNARDVVGEDAPGPQPMRGGRGGYNGQSWSAARGLGESQRRNADSIMQEQMEFLERARNRNGALMER